MKGNHKLNYQFHFQRSILFRLQNQTAIEIIYHRNRMKRLMIIVAVYVCYSLYPSAHTYTGDELWVCYQCVLHSFQCEAAVWSTHLVFVSNSNRTHQCAVVHWCCFVIVVAAVDSLCRWFVRSLIRSSVCLYANKTHIRIRNAQLQRMAVVEPTPKLHTIRLYRIHCDLVAQRLR